MFIQIYLLNLFNSLNSGKDYQNNIILTSKRKVTQLLIYLSLSFLLYFSK